MTGGKHVQSGALSIADPRPQTEWDGKGKYIVTPFNAPAGTVIGASTTGNGAFAVADPRLDSLKADRRHYQTAGAFGVVPWTGPCGAIPAKGQHDNGRWSVADPRIPELPAAKEQLVALIRAIDGTWHRPFTTLELAALQGLVDPEDVDGFCLDGRSDAAWRERIGNAVPRQAATAMANVMGTTLLLAWSGETFVLSAMPIWVQPIAVALSVQPSEVA
jgi:hypothetical protein